MTFSRRHFLGASLALACLPCSAWGAAPEMELQGWLRRWLDAFNSSKPRVYASFVSEHIPSLKPYLQDDLGVREASGGFTLLRSAQTGPREITAWVRDRHWERFSRVVLTIGEKRIDDLSFLGAPAPEGFTVRRLSEADALKQTAHKLRTEAAAGRFAGAVLVSRGERILLREAYGNRSLVPPQPATPQTRYCIGSMGKMFTAVAVLHLVQAGRLQLSDTLVSLLPDYPPTALAREVTVAHLLSHSGGTGDFFGADYDLHQGELRGMADFIRVFGKREPAFAPGSRWGYSNFGFILLGAIIEKITGTDWETCLREQVFRPAGMTATSSVSLDGVSAEPCTGSALTGLNPLAFYAGLPAGGGYSTLDDLQNFGKALRGKSLLDDKHRDLLTRAHIAAGNAQWSLGLRISRRNGVSCYGHGGSAPGINADFAIYPASGYQVVVLANRGHPHALNVAEFIGARLPAA